MNSNNRQLFGNRNTLSRVLGRTDVIAIGFGTMVGWGWVMMTPTWITEAGFWGAILAFILGGITILAIGMIYGELTAALPLAGGEFAFAYRAMGQTGGWFVGWIMTLAYLGVTAWESIALSTSINYVVALPMVGPLWEIAGYQIYASWALIGIVGAMAIMLLNYFGAKSALLFQVIATAALIVIAIVILLGGITFGDTSNMGRAFDSGDGFFYVFLMVPAMLIGFDVIPQSAEEMNISPKNTGKMIIVCIIISLIWYLMLTIGVGLAAPIEIRTTGIIPMADVASYMFKSEAFSLIIVLGGILGILTTWNGFFMGATRLLFSMGRARVIPSIFGRIHSKYNTPYVATIFVGVVCMFAPLLGRNALIWLIDTSSFCALFAYCLVIISFIILREKDKSLDRPFKVKGGSTFGAIILTIVVLYIIIYIIGNTSLTEFNPEFLFSGLWLILGFAFLTFAKFHAKDVTTKEREVLIFGERFARKDGQNED